MSGCTAVSRPHWAARFRTQAPGAEPREAVEEATELLHDDYAYEFQIGWSLWELETENAGPSIPRAAQNAPRSTQDDSLR